MTQRSGGCLTTLLLTMFSCNVIGSMRVGQCKATSKHARQVTTLGAAAELLPLPFVCTLVIFNYVWLCQRLL